MSTAPRKQVPRLARPAARYWKGKAPKGIVDAPSDSDEEDEPEVEEEGDVLIGGIQDIVEEDDEGVPILKDPAKAVKSMNVSLRDVNISKDGRVTVAGREESGRTALEDKGNLFVRSNYPAHGNKCFCIESSEEESDEDEKPAGVKGQKVEESDEVGSQISHQIALLISVIVKRRRNGLGRRKTKGSIQACLRP